MTSDLWDRTYETPAGARWWPNEELVRTVGNRADVGPVLEVGCGNGANLWFLAEHAKDVTGIDISSAALRMCERYVCDSRGCGGVRVDFGSALELPYADGRFQMVVDSMMSQHLSWEDHAVAYRGYRRVLEPGGTLFLYHLDSRTEGQSAPCPSGGSCWDRTDLELFPTVGLTCLPDRYALAYLLANCGFACDIGAGVRWVARGAARGLTASYAVIEARAA